MELCEESFTSTLDRNRQEGENNETEINLCHGQRT